MSMPETTERFIAYFDIMGFKDRVYRNKHADIEETMDKVCSQVEIWKNFGHRLIQDSKGELGILPVIFSDSILFISNGGTQSDFTLLMAATTELLQKMISAGIPIKGALAYGEFTANFHKSKFFGRPLVDAYLLSEQIHFYGAILHHSAEKQIADSGIDPLHIKRSLVPMKDGLITHSLINWFLPHKLNKTSVEETISPLYRTVSGAARKYVDNTLRIYQSLTTGSGIGLE